MGPLSRQGTPHLNQKGSKKKNKQKTLLALLQVIGLPKEVIIVHYQEHLKGDSPETQRNRSADVATWKADLGPEGLLQILVTLPEP